MVKINVLFRACDCVRQVNAHRPDQFDKATLIKACFLSLLDSLEGYPFSIQVIGDRLSPEMVAFFNRYPVTLANKTLGNVGSLIECINRSMELPDDELVYFCEDDYLHDKAAIRCIHELLQGLESLSRPGSRFGRRYGKKPVFVFPADYPDNYKSERLEESFVLLSKDRHWRQVRDITFTFLTRGGTIKKYRHIFMKSAIRARDWRLSMKLFDSGKCFCASPIPSLATHMHTESQSPFFKWQELYTHYLSKISV